MCHHLTSHYFMFQIFSEINFIVIVTVIVITIITTSTELDVSAAGVIHG